MNSGRVRRTQAERKAESDGRMVQAAIECFAQQGYVRTTLNQIGTRAGYTGGLVSKRFGSKEALLREVLKEIYRAFTRQSMTEVAKAVTVVDGLERYIDVFLDRLKNNNLHLRALYRVMGECLGSVPQVQDEIAQFNQQTVRAVGNLLQQGVENGELRADLAVRESATIVLALLRGVTFLYLTQPSSVAVAEVRSEIKTLVEGFRG